MPSIYDKCRLRPSQLKTVADRRFADAQVLHGTRENAHANGAIYLGGFVLELLLKAKLLEKYTWLQSAGSPEGRSADDHRIWSLFYRSHELDEILARLHELEKTLLNVEQKGQPRLLNNLKSLCGQWTIYIRYSPQSAIIKNASDFLEKVKELKKWLQ